MSDTAFASEESLKEIQKEWHGKGHPQYNAAIHLPMLQDIFGKGHGLSAFLATARLSSATFYQWLKDKPEFKHEYELARHAGCAYWEVMPMEAARTGTSMNYPYWMMIWRERYKKTPVQLDEPESDTTTSRMKAAWDSLSKGGVTPQEFNQIASGLSTESRIAEVDLKKQELETAQENADATTGMKDEALKAYMAVMQGKVVLIQEKQE